MYSASAGSNRIPSAQSIGTCKGPFRNTVRAKREGFMVNFEISEEEAKLLSNVLDRYDSHLEVEIVKTHMREFRDALKERQKILKTLIERLKKLVD